MELAAPMAGLGAAVLATPAVIALHMLRLRRRPIRVSTIRFWPRAAREIEANVPIRWPRLTWELLLQLAGVWLLCLALARPMGEGMAGVRDRVVLVVDRSASMGAVEEGRSRFERAIEAVAEEIDALRGSSKEVTLVAMAAAAEVVAGPTRVAGDLGRAVELLAPTDEPLVEARARELLEGLTGWGRLRAGVEGASGDEEGELETLVVVIGDGSWTPIAIPGVEVRSRIVPPPGVEPGLNAGVVALAARRDYRDPTIVRAFARVVANSPRVADVPVVFALDGVPLGSRNATFRGDGGLREAGVSIEFPAPAGGVLTARLARADALASDDLGSLVLEGVPRPAIVLVVPDGDERGWIIWDVLSELTPRALRTLELSEYLDLASRGGLETADVLVFDRVSPDRVPPVPSISFAGAPPGWSLAPGPGGGTLALGWDRRHPLLRGIALDSLYIASPLRLESEPGAPAPEVLADSGVGPLVAEGRFGGVRRIVVAFDPAESNWPALFGFPVFLANAVEHLTVRAGEQESGAVRTGEPARLARSDDGSAPGTIRLSGPVELELSARVDGDDVVVPPIGRAGVYAIAGGVRPAHLAVNLFDERETLARIQRAQEGARAGMADAGGAAVTSRELWPRVLLAAVCLLTAEWMLWALRARPRTA